MKPYEEYTDNLTIKIDWLSFTVQKSMTPKGVIEYFGMDIEEFKEKIFHVHFKDIKLLHDKMQDVGIMATPLQFMVPKLPGLGDVNWNKFVSALTDIGFDGPACIEIEDKSFEKTDEKIKHAVAQATRYMKNFV